MPPKRKPRRCKLCDRQAKLRSKYCELHSCGQKPNWCRTCEQKITKAGNCSGHDICFIPLVEQTIEQSLSGGIPSNRYSCIRDHARALAKKTGVVEKCWVCGYDKVVHTCHIKDISNFPLNALVGEVNALENLVGLCPNCHWEFDHGFFCLLRG